MARILLVDDEKKMVVLLKSALEHRGHTVEGVHCGQEALDRLKTTAFDVVLTDLRMEPVGGMEVLAGARKLAPETEVIILTAYGELKNAVEALKNGAYQYLTKPIDFQEVAHVVEQAAAVADLKHQNQALQYAASGGRQTSEIVGEAPATRALRQLISRVAPSEATVLIRGESGTGKELVARALHRESPRCDRAFVPVNCAAISESLLESELFGYRKGAFTGADKDREGLFEAARGGTLFLDEIGEAGLAVQAKLLRVLEEKKINRVGDPLEREVDVRIVAATNRPLEAAMAERVFREDLYYRLLVFPLDIPPLRDRADDIPVLAEHFLGALGRAQRKLPAPALARLRAYGWPGNVRELRNVMERAHILAGDSPLGDEHVILEARASGPEAGVGADLNLDANARRLIQAALTRAGGNKSEAARLLGITRRTLYSRLELLGLTEN